MLLWPWSPAAGIGILALSHALLLYPTLRPNVQWLGPVVTCFSTDRNEVWLTIDDGPSEQTRAVLDLLDGSGAKATFFVKGIPAQRHADVVREIIARGHSVANHSETHPSFSFWCLLPGRIAMEIDGCNRALQELTGSTPRWFRAPVGMKNPFVHPALEKRGMRLIGWTARAFDAVITDVGEIERRLLPHVTPGAILVMHEGREHSLRALERVITAVRERGYALVIPDDGALRNTKR